MLAASQDAAGSANVFIGADLRSVGDHGCKVLADCMCSAYSYLAFIMIHGDDKNGLMMENST